jgi:hypothetical protein
MYAGQEAVHLGSFIARGITADCEREGDAGGIRPPASHRKRTKEPKASYTAAWAQKHRHPVT